MPGDLDGILVVSLEQAVAAPFASSRLADAGARVIKLERAEGDFARGYDRYVNGQSAYFVWLNRGKQSVFIDIKNPDDKDFLFRLLAKADVFIQNLAPGATERAGVGSAALRERFPKLITCDISGYGPDGPYRDMKAYDLLVQAESGLALLTGNETGPGRVGVSVCDIACGMYAHQAILQALFKRTRTGAGRGIEVSLFHSMADWMNVPYLQHRYGRHQPARAGLNHPTIAPYGVFRCRDGEFLLAIQNEREWVKFCTKVLAAPHLATDSFFANNPARVENRAALAAIMNGVFENMPFAELSAKLSAADIAFGRLSSLDDLEKHPQLRLIKVETTEGTVELLAPPAGVTGGEAVSYGDVPDLGANDAAIREEFSV